MMRNYGGRYNLRREPEGQSGMLDMVGPQLRTPACVNHGERRYT